MVVELILVFLINPAAGKRDRSTELTEQIHTFFADDPRPYEIYVTEAPKDAEEYVRQRASKAPEEEFLFIACGGDGTLNEVVNGAVGLENAAVTHFPIGSGNDFVRTFDPEYRAFRNLPILLQGFPVTLDVIRCCGRYSLNLCSAGIDARIAGMVPRLKRLPLLSGSGSYTLSIAINFFKRIYDRCRVRIDGASYDGDYAMAVAANGAYYGGGYHPIPEARPDDGILDFLLVKRVSRPTFLRVIGKYKSGEYRKILRHMIRLSGRELRLETDRPISVNVDGEILERTSVEIALTGEKLRFFLPDVPEMAMWKNRAYQAVTI